MFVRTRHGCDTSLVPGVLLAIPLAVGLTILAISSGAQAALVGYWTFDEGTGQTVFDSSGYNNHGVLGSSSSVETSDPTRVSGRLGAGALKYTGTSPVQYAAVPDSSSLSVTGTLTLSAWINIAGGTGTNRNILAKHENSAYRWRIDDGQHPWLLINDGPGLAVATSSHTISASDDYNEWHHVAVTFTPGGTNNVSFYYDGVLTDQKTLSKSSIADTTGSLLLGAYSTGSEPFNGSLDEIAIWNQVLTGNQIYALAQGMAATNQPTAGNTPVHWTGGTGAFEQSSNWSGGTVPGATHDAYVNNGGTVQVTATTGTAAPGTLMLGGLGTGTLSLTDGTLSPGNLTVSAGGLLSLQGGTFTPTTIHLDGGTIQLSASFSTSAAVTLDPRGGTLDTADNTLTLSGPVDGPGGFVKLGTGTLTLTGTEPNTFRGTTEIRAGTLILQKSPGVTALGGNVLIGDGTVDAWLRLEADQQIADSAILTFNGTTNAKFELNGHEETIGGLVMSGGLAIIQNRESGGSGTGVLTVANTTDSTWSGYMRNSSGTLALVKDGPAKLTLAGGNITYTGSTTVSKGTLILQNTTNFNSNITNNATLQFDVTTGNSYTFGKDITGSGNLVKSGAGTLTLASSYNYTGTSIVRAGTLLVGANVLPSQNGPLGNATSAIELGDASSAATDNIFFLTNGSFTIGRPITVNSQNTTGLTTIGGATSQTTGSIYSGTITLNRRVYLTSSTTAPNVVDFKGDITGTGGVTTVGSGTVLFTGTKSYQGTTTVLSGTLKLGSANALPSGAGKGDVYLYATLDLGGFDATVNGLWGDGRVTNNRTSAGNNVLTVGANNASSTFSGTIQDGDAGVLGLTKTGVGTLTLTNPQTYTGATVITQGTVRLARAIVPSGALAHYTFDNPNNLGADSAGTHHATVVTNASSATGRVGPGAVRFAGDGFIEVPYSADLALNSFTVSAWVNLSAEPTNFGILGTRFGGDYTFDLKVRSTDIHGDLGTGTAWINTAVDIRGSDFGANGQGGDLPLGRWYLVSYAVDDAAKCVNMYINGDLKRSITYSDTLTALFMKAGQTLHLGESGGGEYMNGLLDDVYIYARALTTEEIQALMWLSSASQDFLPTTTALAIGAGATLDLNGVNQTVGSLADSGSSGGSVLLDNATLTVGTNHASTTFSGTLSGTGNLVKTGSGALTLAGTNSYSGTTAVREGKLLVNGALTGTGDDVTVTGGLLGGTGSISRNVLVELTGRISAADEGTTGTLAIGGDLTLDGTMIVDLGGDTPGSEYDLIQVSGQTILGGTLQVALLPGFIPASQDTFDVLTSGGGIDPTGLILEWADGSLAPAQFWTYHVLGEGGGPQTLQLMLSVPEPSAFLLGAAALAGLLGWAARRRHV